VWGFLGWDVRIGGWEGRGLYRLCGRRLAFRLAGEKSVLPLLWFGMLGCCGLLDVGFWEEEGLKVVGLVG
jgi:hypothetical protein